MKLPNLSLFAVITILSTTLTVSVKPADSSEDKFFCAQLDGIYRVFSRTERGSMTVMNFVRQTSEDWTEQKRCVETARRFQRYYDNDTLRFIRDGEINNQPVLCAVPSKTEAIDCDSNNLLVTLPPGSDGEAEAQQLMNTNSLMSDVVVEVSGDEKLADYVNGTTYYDFQVFENIVMHKDEESNLTNPHLVKEELTPIDSY
ncbi:MAG: hypothetical protein Tsb0014_30800 [Pleurocapsa sp.]